MMDRKRVILLVLIGYQIGSLPDGHPVFSGAQLVFVLALLVLYVCALRADVARGRA